MARDDPEVRLRLSADLKARVEAAAKASGRSMNAEIVSMLEDSLAAGRLSRAEALKVLADGYKRLERADATEAKMRADIDAMSMVTARLTAVFDNFLERLDQAGSGPAPAKPADAGRKARD